jgi:zinc and cadmium transporter
MVKILVIYCVLILLVSLVGGLIPHWVRLTHRRMEFAVSFVGGVMLGVGVFHMLPHAIEQLDGAVIDAMEWMVIGLLVMFFAERFFCYHHHSAPAADADEPEAHHHSCAHHHDHGHQHVDNDGHVSHSHGWTGAFVGFTLHTLLAGVALAASVEGEMPGSTWAGLGTFLVIFLHKPLDSMTIGTLMAAEGKSVKLRHVVNGLFALLVPVGVILFYMLSGGGTNSTVVGAGLAFAAGMFICIALSDLLPELQFHQHDRIKLSLALLLGLAAAYAISVAEHAGHDHGHDHGSGHKHSIQQEQGHEGHNHEGHDHEGHDH